MTDDQHERYGGDSRITPAMEDYLKAILRLDLEGVPVTTQRLADDMQIRAASVTNMVKRLAALGLVNHEPYKGLALTSTGKNIALEVVRHHRLLELFLSQHLDLDIHEVHEEADRLEHYLSETLERRLEQKLGYPTIDPHGHPIPSRAGELPELTDVPISSVKVSGDYVVTRIDDRQAEFLNQLSTLGFAPGVQVCIRVEPDMRATIGKNEVPMRFYQAIWVKPTD